MKQFYFIKTSSWSIIQQRKHISLNILCKHDKYTKFFNLSFLWPPTSFPIKITCITGCSYQERLSNFSKVKLLNFKFVQKGGKHQSHRNPLKMRNCSSMQFISAEKFLQTQRREFCENVYFHTMYFLKYKYFEITILK